MDVRCERCQTEYELEDDSVSEGGTPVQCTTCGHTFAVRRSGTVVTSAIERVPPPADWILETAEGQFHRFRNLTSLQKWIIERRITRQDKISKTGHAWRRLGEIVELAPFFDVVDEADRAKAAAPATSRDLMAGAQPADGAGLPQDPPRAPPTASAVAHRPVTPDQSTGPGDGPADRPPADRPPAVSSLEAPVQAAASEAKVVRAREDHGWWKAAVVLVVAGGVAYAGITRPWSSVWDQDQIPGDNGIAPAMSPSKPEPAEPATEATAIAPPGGSFGEMPAEAEPVPGSADQYPSMAATEEAPGHLSAPMSETAALHPSVPAPELLAPAVHKAAVASDQSQPYEKLVSEADRLLENGATDRAMKLYDRALQLRPNGAEAIAGLGYVSLDRGNTETAINHFRRALSSAPYAPAVFGLAEAYRAAGNKEQALVHYRRYLSVSPSGADAPAARRQVKALESSGAGGIGSSPGPSSVLQGPEAPKAP
jgi:predicted Zn finger-like uncharacterized protein